MEAKLQAPVKRRGRVRASLILVVWRRPDSLANGAGVGVGVCYSASLGRHGYRMVHLDLIVRRLILGDPARWFRNMALLSRIECYNRQSCHHRICAGRVYD
jgi:hypothetical protein